MKRYYSWEEIEELKARSQLLIAKAEELRHKLRQFQSDATEARLIREDQSMKRAGNT